jgi:hypothetical protein
LLPGISYSRSASLVRPCPWLPLHWGPSPPAGFSTGSSLFDCHGACVTGVTSQHATPHQIIKYNLTFSVSSLYYLYGLNLLFMKVKTTSFYILEFV